MQQHDIDDIMMACAGYWSTASYCSRAKVGAVVAKHGRIISTGFNGTIPGASNVCEDKHGNTCDEVMHAEENAVLFCARFGLSTIGATLYTTTSPCALCAKMIVTAGIVRVVYKELYRDTAPLQLLKDRGIDVERFKHRSSFG